VTRPNVLQGHLAHQKTPIPKDHHRGISIFLLSVPKGALFVMTEVPLYIYGAKVPECGPQIEFKVEGSGLRV
jgi:hypothetical protein